MFHQDASGHPPDKEFSCSNCVTVRCGNINELISAQLTTKDLLELCLTGERNAWFEFDRRFRPMISTAVVGALRQWTSPSSTLVDDFVQNTYVKLCSHNFKALRSFDSRHENGFAGFLKVIACNVVRDYMRCSYTKKRGQGKGEDDLDESASIAGFLNRSVTVMERQIILRQIQQYLERQTTYPDKRDCGIFWLYYGYGLTAQEISELPEIRLSVKGVESVLFRLIRLLRVKLGCNMTFKKLHRARIV